MTKLTIELPDDLVSRLSEEARRVGRTVEAEVTDLVLERFLRTEAPAETREAILARMRERWKEVRDDSPVSPEEMKEWINYGRP